MARSGFGITAKSMSAWIEQDEISPYLAKFEAKEVTKSLKKGRTQVGRAARKEAFGVYDSETFKYSKTGNLRASIGYASIRKGTIGVVAGPLRKKGRISKTSGKVVGRKAGFHRHLVEFGTKAHVIVPKNLGGRLAVLGGFATVVHHRGAKPHPWMTRGRDRIVAAADRAFGEFVRKEYE